MKAIDCPDLYQFDFYRPLLIASTEITHQSNLESSLQFLKLQPSRLRAYPFWFFHQ